ncbi:MAG TPA: ATP-binding protein [Alistipes sp.]|nr:ATP-binding protein [Alistipes sp.]
MPPIGRNGRSRSPRNPPLPFRSFGQNIRTAPMTDIAFHITDLAANSLRAGADAIDIALSLDGTQLELAVTDNGCGMAPEAVRRAFDPFYTTRTTRRTGLGLPFLLQSAEGCGGSAAIRSVPGKGTCVRALFMTDHPDSPPAGDLAETLMQIMAGNPGTAFTLTLRCGTKAAGLSTTELSDALGSVPLRLPDAAVPVRNAVAALLVRIFGNGRYRL